MTTMTKSHTGKPANLETIGKSEQAIRQGIIVVDVYCRVSTDEQETNTSLKDQERLCREFVEKLGFRVGMVFHETFTGMLFMERPELTKARDRYKNGITQGIVVLEFDRFTRDPDHFSHLLVEMEVHKAKLYCVNERLDDSILGILLRNIKAAFGKLEHQKIIARTSRGKQAMVREGNVPAGPKGLYGYTVKRILDSKGKVIKRWLEINKKEAAVCRWIAWKYDKGTTVSAIRRQLVERRVPPPSGEGEWSRFAVNRILTDERRTGKPAKAFTTHSPNQKNRYDEMDLPEGAFPRIIDPQVFDRIQERKATAQQFAARNNKDPERFLLRAGYIYCAMCGSRMISAPQKNHPAVYNCIQRNDKVNNPCPGQRVNASKIDTLVWAYMEEIAEKTEVIERAIELATSSERIKGEIESISNTLAFLREQRANYIDDLKDTKLSKETRATIRGLLSDTEESITLWEENRRNAEAGLFKMADIKAEYDKILAWCKKVKVAKETEEELTYQQKRDFLKLMGIKVLIHKTDKRYEDISYEIQFKIPELRDMLIAHDTKDQLCDIDSGLYSKAQFIITQFVREN